MAFIGRRPTPEEEARELIIRSQFLVDLDQAKSSCSSRVLLSVFRK